MKFPPFPSLRKFYKPRGAVKKHSSFKGGLIKQEKINKLGKSTKIKLLQSFIFYGDKGENRLPVPLRSIYNRKTGKNIKKCEKNIKKCEKKLDFFIALCYYTKVRCVSAA